MGQLGAHPLDACAMPPFRGRQAKPRPLDGDHLLPHSWKLPVQDLVVKMDVVLILINLDPEQFV